MTFWIFVVCSVALLLQLSLVVNAVVPADEVTSLPGYKGELPSKQYSGMLTVPHTRPGRHYHYWLVQSETDPVHDPVVFWFNGGPGASSLLGYFTEQGPFNVNGESLKINTTSVPVPFYNEYTWAKVSNIIFLESPAGVGFSYCDGILGPINSCPDWNDTSVAVDNHAIIQQFFQSYPEYMANDFYIFGESYAGIYVPTLVMQIQADPSGMPPLLGFGIGDGCMGIGGYGGCNKDAAGIFFQFMSGHGQMSNAMYQHMLTTCGNSLHFGNETLACGVVMGEAYLKLGGYNIYDIYDMCYLQNDEIDGSGSGSASLSTSGPFKNDEGHTRFANQRMGFNGRMYHDHDKYKDNADADADAVSDMTPGVNQYACGGESATNIYLNNAVVKSALHVPNIPWTWQDGHWDKYHSTQHDLIPYYKQWAKEFRILIYYGDADGGVPYNGGEEWTTLLGYPTLESWRPWSSNSANLMAGYVQIFDTSGTNFTYVTVRGAGHMVPQYKPQEALKMYSIFLNNEPWPPYSSS